MRAPSVNELDELVQTIEDLAILISHLTYQMFQQAKKDNPHLNIGKPLSKKQQAQMPKFIPSEITLEMTDQIMGLQDLMDQLLDRLKTILRMVDNATIEKARQHHERLRPGTAHDPMTRDIVQKLDLIYKSVKEERGNDTSVFA